MGVGAPYASPWLRTKGWVPSVGQSSFLLNADVSQTIWGWGVLVYWLEKVTVSMLGQ